MLGGVKASTPAARSLLDPACAPGGQERRSAPRNGPSVSPRNDPKEASHVPAKIHEGHDTPPLKFRDQKTPITHLFPCSGSQDKLKAWIGETLPRSTREIGAWIARECGIEYQARSGLIALLHRLGMEHRKPKAISRKLDPAKQAAFIKTYEDLLNQLPADEAVMFADAVHPTHAVRPVGCWAPKEVPVAVEQSSGRDRLNIHGAIDLETGKTVMRDVLTVDAVSTIMLLMAIEAMYPGKRLVHVFLDNARYHHAKLVQAWLAQAGAAGSSCTSSRPTARISTRSNDYGG